MASSVNESRDAVNGDRGYGPSQHAALAALLEPPLRAALSRVIVEGSIDSASLRDDLRAICDHARRCELRIEQLLIAVRDFWTRLELPHDHAPNADGTPLLNQVVAMTLDEYFVSPNAGSRIRVAR